MGEAFRTALVITKPSFHDYMAPLGYLYVAAAMQQDGVDVRVINLSVDSEHDWRDLGEALRKYRPHLVITGTSYKFHNNCPSPTVSSAVKTTELAKSIDSACTTLLIGPLNSVLGEELLSTTPSVDAAALGEAEEISVAVCRALQGGKSMNGVRGLAIRDDGGVRLTGPAEYPDLETMPFPARELIDFAPYIRDSHFSRRATGVLTSRGCPFNCTYCFGARESRRHEHNIGQYYRTAPAERVAAEIDLLYRRWGVRGVNFDDVEFCVSKRHVAEVCEQILKRGYKDFRWRAITRVTSVGRDLLRLMRKAGCRNIYYGVESGDATCLKAMDKRISLDEIREAFRQTKEAGIRPEASFLLGIPGETEESAQRTIRFACELDPFAATFHVFVPFPGIPLEESLGTTDAGEASLDRWDVYQLNVAKSYCDIPAERLKQLSQQAYRRFYLRPGYIAKTATRLCDPHMLRFVANSLLGRRDGGLVRNMLLGRKKKERGDSQAAYAASQGGPIED